MKRHIIGGAVLALISATAAAAQPAAVDPARLKLAQAVVEATGGRGQAQAQVASMFGAIEKMTTAAMPGADAGLVHAFQHDMQEQLSAMVPALLEISTRAYAKELSQQELTDMLAWVSSPSGRSVAAKRIAIQQDIFSAEAPLVRGMMPGLMQKTFDRVCNTSKCTPQQRQAMAQTVAKLGAGAPG